MADPPGKRKRQSLATLICITYLYYEHMYTAHTHHHTYIHIKIPTSNWQNTQFSYTLHSVYQISLIMLLHKYASIIYLSTGIVHKVSLRLWAIRYITIMPCYTSRKRNMWRERIKANISFAHLPIHINISWFQLLAHTPFSLYSIHYVKHIRMTRQCLIYY